MSNSASLPRPAKATAVVAWVIQVLLAVAFLAAASAKLVGVPMLVEVFDQIGVGQWFRIVTALVEIAGAIALLVPGLAALGAALLGVTMVFAVLTHIVILHNSPAAAVVLLLLNAAVLWLRRDQIAKLWARLS
jgi:putative oxidoreductase